VKTWSWSPTPEVRSSLGGVRSWVETAFCASGWACSPNSPPGCAAAVDVNGEPAIVLHADAVPVCVATVVAARDERVAEVLLVVAPSKLAYARRQAVRAMD
jgi:hypothetical protein